MDSKTRYRIAQSIAWAALSAWGQGWKRLNVEQRKAELTLCTYRFLSGSLWADDKDRCKPGNVTMEDFHAIMETFKSCDEKYLIKGMAKAPKEGLTEDMTHLLFQG